MIAWKPSNALLWMLFLWAGPRQYIAAQSH